MLVVADRIDRCQQVSDRGLILGHILDVRAVDLQDHRDTLSELIGNENHYHDKFAFMPDAQEQRRGGAARHRTIRVGTGRRRRYLHIAIVRKAGPRGGHTIAGPTHAPKGK